MAELARMCSLHHSRKGSSAAANISRSKRFKRERPAREIFFKPEAVMEIFSAPPQPSMTQNPTSLTPCSTSDPTLDQIAISSETTGPPVQTTTPVVPTDGMMTRSGRIIQPTWLIKVLDVTLTDGENGDEFYIEDKDPLLFAFAASADPDTMYLHEAMRQPD
jgi:hypothetical protein